MIITWEGIGDGAGREEPMNVRGFAKKTNSKNPRLLWKWVGGSRSHSEFVVVENRPKIALSQY